MPKTELDFFYAFIEVFDDKQQPILKKHLIKIPLAEKYYEIEGEKRLGTRSPCILERKLIEKEVCIESVQKIELNRVYSKKEILWLFELYDLPGEYIRISV